MSEVEHQTQAQSSREASRGLVRKVLLATLLGVAVFGGLSLYADLSSLAQNLGRFRWEMFALAILLATGNYALRFVRWQRYLQIVDVKVPAGESALIFLAGFVMSVTPGKLGEVFKSLLLFERRGAPILRTAPIVLAERLTDLIALVLLTAAGSLAFPQGLPVALGGGALVGLLLLASAWRPLGELFLRIADKLPVVKRIAPRLREAYDALHALSRPGPLLAATSISIASWALESVALYVVVLGFEGASIGWDASLFSYSASTIAGALAMMPGGLGVTEAGMTGLIDSLGDVDTAAATAATMLVRLATLWWAVLLGAIALAWLRRSAPRTR